MPKQKTKRGLAKRVRVTKKGKIKYKKANLRHILTTKSRKSKRHKRKKAYVPKALKAKVIKELPYLN